MKNNDKRAKAIPYSLIATNAGVSVATVSRVLNNGHLVKDDTRERVYIAMEQLGQPVQARPKSDKPQKNKVIVMNLPTLGNTFYNEIVQGATIAAKYHGYQLLTNISELRESPPSATIAMLRSIRAVGLITCNCLTEKTLQSLSHELPTVQCCEYCEDVPDISYVTIDDIAAASKVTEYLLALGKQRIAIITGQPQYKYSRHRLIGYINALKKAGLPILNNYIIELPEISYESAYPACQSLFSQPQPPQAVFATSDFLAAVALRAAVGSGLSVPEDVSIIGFDNIDISKLTSPSLTTINQPQYQLGFTACELLIEQIESPKEVPPRQVMLNVELILRESTRAL